MLPLIRQLGILAFGRVRPTAKRLSRSLIGGAVAAVFGLTAYVALLLALGLFFSSQVGPVYAALIIAVIAAMIGGIIVVSIQQANRRSERRMEARRRAARAQLPDPLTLQLLAGVPALLKGRSLLMTVAIAALVFGVAKAQGSGRDRDDD